MFSHTIFGGEKDNWLVAFYGFGQSANVFSALYEKVKSTHSILVVDNPMQDYESDIYPEDLKNYLYDLLDKLNVDSFDSVSFSMGGRLNLYLPAFFPNRLKKIIVVAPDGIKFNFWNRVAISTPWGRRVFKYFVFNGSAYMNSLLFFHKIGVVNKSLYAFSKWNMRDLQRRKNVYNAWMNMRYLRPNLKEINAIIEENKVKLISVFGEKDPVIPLSIQERCKNIFPKGKHLILNTDHNILKEELFSIIAEEVQP